MAERVEENENSGVDSETTDRSAENISKPPRKKRRIIRKILLVLLVVMVLLAGYWIFEDIRWTRRLDAQLAEYRAAGQPVDIEDFAPPPTPDDNNAALAYKKAFELLELTDEQKDLIEDFSPEKITASPDMMKAAIDANPKSLKLLRDARTMTGCDWGIKYRRPVEMIILPAFGNARKLGEFLGSAAVYEHNTKNDAAAVESIRDMLSLANPPRKGFLIGSLAAFAIDATAYDAIEAITKDLAVATAPSATTAGKHPASKKAVELLIRALLDEKNIQDDWVRTFYVERTSALATYQLWLKGDSMLNGDFFPGLLHGVNYGVHPLVPEELNTFVLRPWHKQEMLRMLKDRSLLVQAAGQKHFSDAKGFFPPSTTAKGGFGGFMIPFRELLTPLCDISFTLYFRSIANRRMAGIALAMRLYEIDNGHRPAMLEELVPKYLPAVPVDPFSPDGKAIQYRPDLKKPVLYSVGENQTDQGGQYAASPDEVPDPQQYDIVFFLNGDRPREEPPSAE